MARAQGLCRGDTGQAAGPKSQKAIVLGNGGWKFILKAMRILLQVL